MNELKREDVMRALECCENTKDLMACQGCPYYRNYGTDGCVHKLITNALTLLREKDAEIERLTKERDEARKDCAVAEQLHYDCKKELEEMSDDILDSVRAERDRYKAESQQYQSAFLKLKKFYSNLNGSTSSGSVEYHIDQVAKEMREKQ